MHYVEIANILPSRTDSCTSYVIEVYNYVSSCTLHACARI